MTAPDAVKRPAPTFRVAGGEERIQLTEFRLIVAGYTGRDEAKVAAHIAELAKIGVAPPPEIPMFYELDPALLSPGRNKVVVPGRQTSGEVEPVLVRHRSNYYLGVGSDHTARDLETVDIARSKAACPKPIASEVVRVRSLADATAWDTVQLTCDLDGRPYQRGRLESLTAPPRLLISLFDRLGQIDGDFVLFCGTVPLLDGEFAYGRLWEFGLSVPGGDAITHSYEIEQAAN